MVGVDFDDVDDEQWWQHVPARTLRAALTLSQSTWWVDSESSPHFVDTMSAAHRDAVIDFLLLHSRTLLVDVQETAARARAGSAGGHAAAVLLGPGVELDDSGRWIESTPLMQRLRQLSGRELPGGC